MEFLGFKSCKADLDVWIWEAVKDDSTKYFDYVILYVDDCICLGVDPGKILRNEIRKYFKLKESSIGLPGQYLGGKIRKVLLENGIEWWALGYSQYVQEAVRNIRNYLSEQNKTLTKRVKALLTRDYHPEVN